MQRWREGRGRAQHGSINGACRSVLEKWGRSDSVAEQACQRWAQGRVAEQVLELRGCERQYSRWRLHLCTQLGRRMPGPARVEQDGARQRHHVGPLAMISSACCASVTADAGKLAIALDAFGKRHLVARSHGNLLLRRNTAAGDVDEIGAQLLEFLRETHALLELCRPRPSR